ncbi:MAG: hypothetical protein VKP62_13220 [Candidatus Sericytochromatia bacterium]|nr:hypothetical protein [Candidatus Sericytochromatia bacterium]
MIVSFSVDRAVFEAFDPHDAVVQQAHLRLQEAWRLVGKLHLPTRDDERRAWFRALQQLPTPLRKRWQQGLMQNRWALADQADLHCVTPAQAAASGLTPTQISLRPAGQPETCRFDCADRALGFQQARAQAHLGIPAGTRVQELWERKFAALLAQARHVVLVDRYALAAHLDTRRAQPSGLARLLRELDGLTRPVNVTLYTQLWSGHRTALKQLAAGLTQGGIREWRVRLAQDETFVRHAHDRHLRIDRTLIQLGKGIEVLAGEYVFGASDYDLKPFTPFARQREEELRRACREWRWRPGEPARAPGAEGG